MTVRRHALVMAALAVAALVFTGGTLPGAGGAVAAAAAKHRRDGNLLINAQDAAVWPSRGRLSAGPVYVELWNRGQDPHAAWIRRLNRRGQMVGPLLGQLPLTLPGQVSQATWHLKPGHYELSCSVPGDLTIGLQARLTITRN